MSTHNICFRREIRKLLVIFGWKKCLIWSYDCLFVVCLKPLQYLIGEKGQILVFSTLKLKKNSSKRMHLFSSCKILCSIFKNLIVWQKIQIWQKILLLLNLLPKSITCIKYII